MEDDFEAERISTRLLPEVVKVPMLDRLTGRYRLAVIGPGLVNVAACPELAPYCISAEVARRLEAMG
jgi:hypothetical protein